MLIFDCVKGLYLVLLVPLNILSPPVFLFTDRSEALLLLLSRLLCMFTHVCIILSCLYLAALCHLLGKG